MCGICGVSFHNKNVPEALVKAMCDKITHRGPDEAGYFAHENFGMGMRRLSIIDLSTGTQPIYNEEHSLAIVFNGEIYNFQSIRDELKQKGHKFYTNADTEAIIHAYEEFGEESPKQLNGMFAYSIFDSLKKKLFLARDRIGIKPLYYYWDGQTFAYGSEIKTILEVPGIDRTVDVEALNRFLTFEYIPSPESIFKKIRKLPPGHWLVFENGNVIIQKYWDVPFTDEFHTEGEAKEELRSLLSDSVNLRLISDVPLGAFLSGGIDSSTIVGLMAEHMDQPVKSFSIGFEDSSYNELGYAGTVAKAFQTEHKEFIIQPDAVSMVEKLIYHLDEPFGDFSIFPTYLVSKMAREHVTVILSGDGGDELFGGYDTYVADKMAQTYRQIPGFIRKGLVEPFARALPPTSQKKGIINKIKRFTEGAAYPKDLQHVRWMIFLSEKDRAALFLPDHLENIRNGATYSLMRDYFSRAKTGDRLNQQSFVDVKTYLVDDILVKVDRMSMATSLEARVPFLDHRIVEFAFRVPGNLKIKNGETKYILKETMRDLLPEKILTRDKQGFSIPIKNWIRNELKEMMLDILSPEKIRREGFFQVEYINRLVEEHLKGKENHSHRLWALMMFEWWYDLYGRQS